MDHFPFECDAKVKVYPYEPQVTARKMQNYELRLLLKLQKPCTPSQVFSVIWAY